MKCKVMGIVNVTPDSFSDGGRYFRPEAAVLTQCADAYSFTCNVELTEMLGDYTNVYIMQDGQQAILKVDSHDTPETDQPMSFCIPYENVYLFDGETENVISEN